MRILYRILQYLFPNLIFYYKNSNEWHLTIDDSPSEHTPELLELLDNYGVKAIFFCIGQNIERYPEHFLQIQNRGHIVGYHSYAHVNAWRQSFEEFMLDFEKCEALFTSHIYRPPYGKFTWKMYRYLQKKGIKIMLWDILTEDWKHDINPLEKIQEKIKAALGGSIFVFHDSEKARENSKIMLTYILENNV